MAQAFAYFIREDYLKKQTAITQNVDPMEVFPFVRTAQEDYIQDAIGYKLYNRLITGLIASTPGTNDALTADEIDLLILLRQALAWYAAYDAMPGIAFKLTNKGILEFSGDNSNNATDSSFKMLRSHYRTKAEMCMQRVQDYLCLNGQLFPEYISPGNTLPPHKDAPYSGMGFDVNDPSYLDIEYYKNKKFLP